MYQLSAKRVEWRLKRRWQILLGVLISLAFLWYALHKLELGQVWYYLRTATYWWILPGVLVYFVAVWARTWRWHYLLRQIKAISLKSLFPVVCIGYFGNNVYPLRAGEVIRAFVLRRNQGVAVSASLATIIIERVFDGLVMLLFVFFALPFVGQQNIPAVYRSAVIFFSIFFLVALLIFAWMAFDRRRATAVYTYLADRFVPARVRPALDGFYHRFLDGLQSLRNGRDALMVLLTSVVIWLLETVKYWFVMHAFHFAVSFIGLMLMNGVVNLTTTLPSAPGYVGTFEVGASVLQALGVQKDLAFGYTIVLHAALWLPITALGAWYMWREGLRWRDFDAAQAAKVGTEPGIAPDA
jgi:glycosyltransferase 2 family protein